MSANFSHACTLTASGLNWLKSKLARWPQVVVEATPEESEDGTVLFSTRVSLNAPHVPGHTFLARIEHLSEGNVIYRAAGEEKVEYRTAKPWCDHCKTERRRNDAFVLRCDATTAEKRVGRNCLAEYVRDEKAAADLMNWASCVDRITTACGEAEERMGGGRAPEAYTLEFVLSWARAYGGKWVSASQARETGEQASAYELLGMIRDLRDKAKDKDFWHTRQGQQIRATEAKAEELRNDETSGVYQTLAWIDSLAVKPETAVSDYENNLTVIRRMGFATVKQWSFVCSAFRAWLRSEHVARGEAVQKAREAAGPKGNWLGEKGQRLGFEKVNCVEKKSLGIGEFGERFLVKFMSPAGNELVWFTGPCEFDAGVEYDITGTVKDHNEFRGQRSTVLSRVVKGITVKKSKKAKQ